MPEPEAIPGLETEEERNKLFVMAFGEEAWDAVKARSTELGRKLTMEEVIEITDPIVNPPEPLRFEVVKAALSGRSLHLHGDTVYEPDYGGHCLGCFDG